MAVCLSVATAIFYIDSLHQLTFFWLWQNIVSYETIYRSTMYVEYRYKLQNLQAC